MNADRRCMTHEPEKETLLITALTRLGVSSDLHHHFYIQMQRVIRVSGMGRELNYKDGIQGLESKSSYDRQ